MSYPEKQNHWEIIDRQMERPETEKRGEGKGMERRKRDFKEWFL